jgi:hypothetical protein
MAKDVRLIFRKPSYRAAKSFFGEARPDSAGEDKPFRAMVANKQSAKLFTAAFRRRVTGVTANHELLLLGEFYCEFYFNPGTAALARFIGRI